MCSGRSDIGSSILGSGGFEGAMRIEQELEQAHIDRESVLTIGVFDGVHRGHQRLIAKVVAEANANGAAAGVLTFRNHPDSVLNPNFRSQYITSVAERTRLMEELGVDFVVPGYIRQGGRGAPRSQIYRTAEQ